MTRDSLSIALCLLTTACGADTSGRPGAVTTDTLPNGAVLLRYAALDTAPPVLEADLSLGARGEGTGTGIVFGDVRGIEADAEGTIYVLDYQASEVRAFDRNGDVLRVVAGEGEGPGEITEANGILLAGDSLLWINDHAKWTVIGVDPSGEERARVPMHVRAYGYIWSGTVDHDGRFWRSDAHSDEERSQPPEEGLLTSTFRMYQKSYDPGTEVVDSVFLGEGSRRVHVSQPAPGAWSYRGIPSDPESITLVDRGGGFWMAHTDRYRIARLEEDGDTTLVIEVDAQAAPVTDEDRERYVTATAERSPEAVGIAREIAELIPETKPVLSGVVMDDQGRLWVRRMVGADERSRYDVFSRQGEYEGSVTLGFDATPYFPVRIRHGRIYALVLDELDVPSVVRSAPLAGVEL